MIRVEIWKDIKGYEGFYQVSNKGRVKSINRHLSAKRDRQGDFEWEHKGKILKQELCNTNAYRVTLCKEGKVKRFLVHRLVAEAFIPNPENKPEVNHKNGNRRNNEESNLEWATRPENMIHAYQTGLQVPIKGEKHHGCKLSDNDIKYIREVYIPKHKEFGRIPLSKKFDISIRYLCNILNGSRRQINE